MMMERLAVIGLGYVGLPVASSLARRFGDVVGFDIDTARVDELTRGEDRTGELAPTELCDLDLRYTNDPRDLGDRTFFIVTVPTPVDANRQPDLAALKEACRLVGKALLPGSVVVIESTVYPGVTEEICAPILAQASGLEHGVEFTLGYSPERINPGDREHRLETIVKVISGSDAKTLERVAAVYGPIVTAGLHRAPSIRVAEAAKVIENTQRDLNIALMNELAIIFDRLEIRTHDVLAAAATKWNFLRFMPGLVGGHCIGVDPYYLTAKAESVGYHPEVILAGRRINDDMGHRIAQKLVKMLVRNDVSVSGATVGILGLTFKEDVPDLRNSRVPDIVRELADFNVEVRVHDPHADPQEAREVCGITLMPLDHLRELDAVVFAVPHRAYLDGLEANIADMLNRHGIVIDIKSVLNLTCLPPDLVYWSL